MFVMRYTVIDSAGSVSFVGPCSWLKALVAGCATTPATLDALLQEASRYDHEMRDQVLSGLRVFDEHNLPGDYGAIGRALDPQAGPAHETPVFRVGDARTREVSLTPVKAGLVLFNLPQKRIIQVQNTYAEVQREDRGRFRKEGRPTGRFYHYQLPADWAIVP
jgi:hypothetical protein